MLAVKALTHITKEMSLLQFSAYGSLYFADAPIDKASLVQVSDGFCIGSYCGNTYWSGARQVTRDRTNEERLIEALTGRKNGVSPALDADRM